MMTDTHDFIMYSKKLRNWIGSIKKYTIQQASVHPHMYLSNAPLPKQNKNIF